MYKDNTQNGDIYKQLSRRFFLSPIQVLCNRIEWMEKQKIWQKYNFRIFFFVDMHHLHHLFNIIKRIFTL